MSAPVVETIRPGVTFTPAAASSFRRVEARLGRRADVNSTYRDWNKQWGMYTAWNAYVAGRGPRPSHSRAIHPDLSKHCQGLAWDSDDWRTPGFIKLAAEYGWIRTAAGDPTEQHHFEYQSWRDQHLNEPAGDNGTPIIDIGEDGMKLIRDDNGSFFLVGEFYSAPFGANDVTGRTAAADVFGSNVQVSNASAQRAVTSANERRASLIAEIVKSVTAQIPKTGGGGVSSPIDYAALAKAVNDDAARRLAN